MSANKLRGILLQHNEDISLLKELKIAYASAMWSWSRIESDLFAVYIAAIDGFKANFAAAQESYFSVVSAKNRLDITHHAAKASWDGSALLTRWLPIEKVCRTELSARGRVAHLTGRVLIPEKPHQKRLAIVDEHFWHPKRKMKYSEAKSVGFTANHLLDMSRKWDDLHRQLWDFHSPLWDAKLGALSPIPLGPPAGLLNPPPLLPTQDRKERRRRPQPSQR